MDVHKIYDDNGEVFLSKYFDEQIARSKPAPMTSPGTQLLTRGVSSRVAVNPLPVVPPVLAPITQHPTNNCMFIAPAPVLEPIPQHPTNNCLFIAPPSPFIPPVPLAVYMATSPNWAPRPNDCCYATGHYYCMVYSSYLAQKNVGGATKLGRS